MPNRLLVKVNDADNVAIAVQEIKAGTQVTDEVVTRHDIPQAHKVALVDILKGEPVIRYGVILGYAKDDIEKGGWINEFMLELPTPPSVNDMEYGKNIVTDLPVPPITVITRIISLVWYSALDRGASPVIMACSAPARPVTAPEITNACSLSSLRL